MKFDCTKCGACCAPTPLPDGVPYPAGRGYVQLFEQDIARIPEAKRLHILLDPWRNTFETKIGVGRTVCSMLEGEVAKDCSCSIHKHRPDVCRAFENGGAQCQHARSEAGLPQEPAYVVTSSDEECAAIVYAATSKQARSNAVGSNGFENDTYIEISCRRAPEFDNRRPSDEELCRDHGWHFECNGCYRRVHQYDLDEGAKFINDDAWCAKCIAEEKVA